MKKGNSSSKKTERININTEKLNSKKEKFYNSKVDTEYKILSNQPTYLLLTELENV